MSQHNSQHLSSLIGLVIHLCKQKIQLDSRHHLVLRHWQPENNQIIIIPYTKICVRTCSWLPANLLTLNSSKTEFLLIGLQQFTTAHSIPLIQLGTLVSSLTVISLSPTKHHLSLSLVIITFVNFVVSAPILTSKLPVPLPHLLSTLSLITATLCITTFQNLKQIVFRLFRTLLPGLWLRIPNYVTSPLFSSLYIGLKSSNALNIISFSYP